MGWLSYFLEELVGHMNNIRIVWKYAEKKQITLLLPDIINIVLGSSGL